MLLHQTSEVQIFYDLLVVCLLHPLAILRTSSVDFPLWSIFELQQNLCSNKSSLIQETSPSVSPLRSVFWHLSGSIFFQTIWALISLGCHNILTLFYCSLCDNIKTTNSSILNMFLPLCIIFFFSNTNSMTAKMHLYIILTWTCELWAHVYIFDEVKLRRLHKSKN